MNARISISRVANGFIVEMTDPKIVAQNMKSDGKYRDPDIKYVAEDWDAVKKYLDGVTEDMLPPPEESEYSNAFSEIAKGDD